MKNKVDKEVISFIGSTRQWASRNRHWILLWALPLTLLFFFLYYPACKWLVATWSHDKPYSHGFFVPFIVLYLVWLKRRQLSFLSFRPSKFVGSCILFACAALLLLGRLGATIQLELVSLYFFFPGVILLFWGWRVLKALWFPLVYLQFMIPWIDPLLSYVYPVFRHIAATLGTWFLSFIYPVMQDGTNIYLPNITLSVINACSGINFFISVTALGILLAYLTQKTWKRFFMVLAAGGLVTIVANGVRVALAGIMGEKYGAGMLHGPGHIFRGWFVAQFGWVLIFFINWLIARIPHPEKYFLYEQWKKGRQDEGAPPACAGTYSPNWKSYIIVYTILFSFGVYLNFFAPPAAVDLRADLASVPMYMGGWKGNSTSWPAGGNFFPGVVDELNRNYTNKDGRSVYLYIGYFPAQNVDARLVSYHSRPLFKAGKISSLVTDEGKAITVRLTHAIIGTVRYQILSWYQFPDGILVNEHKVKVKSALDALAHHRNNGAVVIIAATETGQQAKKTGQIAELKEFAGRIAPVVRVLLQESGEQRK